MNILITAIIDVKKTAPNRLHHFIKYLSVNHEITVICLNDAWKAKQVTVASHYKDFDEIMSSLDVKYITEKNVSPIQQEILSPIYFRNIRELRERKFDVIFNYNTLVLGYYLTKMLKVPMVYDIADDLPAMIGDSPQIPKFLRGIGKWIGSFMMNRTIHTAKRVCAISDVFRKEYSIPQEKFQIISNGVDTSIFKKVTSSIRQDLDIDRDFVLGYVGVLREWVDFVPVYRALKKIDNTKLIIVGQEGLYQENKQLVKELGIENKVFFIGNVPYADVPRYIAAMDVCIIPFKDNAISHNAVPLKLFEYMACEKPVISSELLGIRDIVKNRIIYATNDAEWHEAIHHVQTSKSSIMNLGQNRQFVIDQFEWMRNSHNLEKECMKVLN
jgi:glycosyltransferase involved in cell wall biosynthesis